MTKTAIAISYVGIHNPYDDQLLTRFVFFGLNQSKRKNFNFTFLPCQKLVLTGDDLTLLLASGVGTRQSQVQGQGARRKVWEG